MQGYTRMVGAPLASSGLTASECANSLGQKPERRLDMLTDHAGGVRNVVGLMGARVADLRLRLIGTRPPIADKAPVPGVSGPVANGPLDEIGAILSDMSILLDQMRDDLDALATL